MPEGSMGDDALQEAFIEDIPDNRRTKMEFTTEERTQIKRLQSNPAWRGMVFNQATALHLSHLHDSTFDRALEFTIKNALMTEKVLEELSQ